MTLQPACAVALWDLVRCMLKLIFHSVAVTEPNIMRVRMIGAGEACGGTDAWVARASEVAPGYVEYSATTLHTLLADRLAQPIEALLKLHLEGHEVPALRCGPRFLRAGEVTLTELQFYVINDNGRPVFADVLKFPRERGFELYDFACLSQRPRDMRLRMGDVVFVRRDSPPLAD